MIDPVKIAALLLALICQAYSPLAAQDQPDVKEPEALDEFFYLVSTRDIRPLERQTPQKGTDIKGNHSPIRFVQGEPLAFVVKPASQDVNPKTIIRFLRLTVKGEDRVMAEIASGSKKDGTSGTVPFEVIGYSDTSFKIKPKADLGPGEYALRLSSEQDAFCFAVDPVKTDLK